MADYKMRNNDFLDSHNRKIAVLKGTALHDDHNRKIAVIKGNNIHDSHNLKVATIKGSDVYDSHNRKIASIDDIRKLVKDSMGGASVVAFWLFFIR